MCGGSKLVLRFKDWYEIYETYGIGNDVTSIFRASVVLVEPDKPLHLQHQS